MRSYLNIKRAFFFSIIMYQVIFLAGPFHLRLTVPSAQAQIPQGGTPRVAVVDFGGKLPDESIRKNIVVSVRNAFESVGVQAINESSITSYIEQRHTGIKRGGEKLKKAYKLLRDGKRAYNKLKFNEATERLSLAKKELINNLNELKNNNALLQSYLYLGMTYAALGKEEDAYSEFKKVLYLDPKKHLTSKKYSPSVFKIFESAKRDMKQLPRGTVLLDSVPSKCKVYVNAKDVGITPLNLLYPVGEYFIKVEKEGYLDWYQLISVEDKVNSVEVELIPLYADEDLIMSLRPVMGSNTLDPISDQNLKDMARKIRADIVVLGWIERDARDILFAQLWDARTGKLSNLMKGNLGKNFSRVDNGVKSLVSDLSSEIDSRGYVAGQVQTQQVNTSLSPPPKPPTPAQIAKKKKRDWKRKWWVWAIIGAFAGGATYGIVRGIQAKSGGGISVDNSGNF